MILVSLDWVSVSFERSRQLESGASVVLDKAEKGIQTFKTAHRVSVDGEPVGILYSDNNLTNSENLVQLKFDNGYLYSWKSLSQIIELLIDELGLKYVGLCRVDICGDFIDERLLSFGFSVVDFCRKVAAGSIKRAPLFQRAKSRVVYDQNFEERPQMVIVNGEPETVYFGKTNIRARLYNKSKELKVSQKSYILEWWNLNGLSPSGDVWRFELEFSGLSSHLRNLHYSGQNLKAFYKWLDDPVFYTALYFDIIRRNYCFSYSSRKGSPVVSPVFSARSMANCVDLSHNLYYGNAQRPDGIEENNYFKGVKNTLRRLAELPGEELSTTQKRCFSLAAQSIELQFFKISRRIRAGSSTPTPVSNTGVS